jgi:hypothetical protein
MKTIVSTFMFLFATTVLSAQKITTDMDDTYDFSKIKTWEWLGLQEGSTELNDLDRKRMGEAFLSELNARKLVYQQEEADIALSIFIVVSKETSTTAYTNYYGGSGYRYGRGGRGWGGGYASTNYTENDYLEGTIVLDVFDVKSQELIWQGVATGTVKEKPEKREKALPKTVAKLMKKFPIAKVK